jgi:hypothetical protein
VNTPGHAPRDPCPHCGNVADVEPARVLRYRCRVCGGPRVPLGDASYARAGTEHPALAEAQRARFKRAAWAVTGGVVGGFGLLSLAVAFLVLGLATPGLGATVTLLGAVAVPLLFGLFALGRVRRTRSQLEAALDSAWLAVAKEVLSLSAGELSAARLAELMRTNESRAERLLAALNVDEAVHSRVTDGGDLVFSTGTLERFRVEDSRGRGDEADSTATGASELSRRGPESS